MNHLIFNMNIVEVRMDFIGLSERFVGIVDKLQVLLSSNTHFDL